MPNVKYQVEIMPKAARDLKSIPQREAANIIERINGLMDGLRGDVKRLTNFTPEYRLRCGKWRVLFEMEGDRITIHRIMQRKDVYRFGG